MSLPLDDQFAAAAELERSGSHGDALAAYDAIYRELEDETDLDSRDGAAKALILQAEILDELGHHEDELRLRELVVEREQGATELRMRERVARTLVNIALTFRDLDRGDDQITTLDLVVATYGDAYEREIAAQVMRALSEKARLLRHRERREEALVLYEAIVSRDEGSYTAGRALFDKACCLAELCRLDEAVEACRECIARFEDSGAGTVQLIVRARVNEAIYLGRLGANDEALAIYREIVDGPVDLDDERLVEDVLRAAVYAAGTIRNLGRPAEAVRLLHDAIDRVFEAPGREARRWIGSTLNVHARTLGELGRVDEAVVAYDQAITMFEPGETLERREWIADALIAQGVLLRDRGDRAAAAARLRSVFERFADDPGGRLPQLAAWSGATAARLLDREGMRTLSQAIVDRFGRSDDPDVQQLVEAATLHVTWLSYRERVRRLFVRA